MNGGRSLRHSTLSIWRTMKVFILFTGSTILFYYGIMWVNNEYQQYNRYDEPESGAVKVFQPLNGVEEGWYHRLILFYRDGE
ncbi:membrane protein [Bacillus coahuilensis m2-6]|uniref:Membrane protein n=2 Tax=Bacillus coahuilensis TaxID=408580 RepID=A0A147K880_9BACI|nr:membrane protein [Bacillus coahuilensis p1.1.43]KUP07686.1 membrane protein [Bacillus coahuilensis m2-6]